MLRPDKAISSGNGKIVNPDGGAEREHATRGISPVELHKTQIDKVHI